MKYGRKFWFCVLAVGAFTALLVGGYINQTTYRDLVAIVLTGYLVANVAQKATAKTTGAP
jgi:hypothetical protein